MHAVEPEGNTGHMRKTRPSHGKLQSLDYIKNRKKDGTTANCSTHQKKLFTRQLRTRSATKLGFMNNNLIKKE